MPSYSILFSTYADGYGSQYLNQIERLYYCHHKCSMRNKIITQPFHELLHESEMEGIHSTQVIIDALRLPLIDISFKTNAIIITLKPTFKLSLLLTSNNDLILHFSNHRQQKLRFLRLIILQLMSIINDCYSKLSIL